MRLANLLEAIQQLPGTFRVRLSSIEATEVTRELIRVMASSGETVCPHLHISMQSGSDSVLRRMRRRWGAQRFMDRCALVCESLDLPALTTDVIVGFPGETEADFLQTCDVVRQVGFSKIHIFPFSARKTTPAAEMPDQIPKAEKQRRVAELARIEQQLRVEYFQRLEGRQLQVLVEGPAKQDPQRASGTACRYAPVQLPWNPQLVGQLVAVQAGPATEGRYIHGQLVEVPTTRSTFLGG
jgi:threonylcarbamoyladenosine tRNA methylthiotransferase MtaB